MKITPYRVNFHNFRNLQNPHRRACKNSKYSEFQVLKYHNSHLRKTQIHLNYQNPSPSHACPTFRLKLSLS